MIRVLVIHGPNLDLLGDREPEIYGKISLKNINKALESLSKKESVKLKIFQSNHEGEIVSAIGHANLKFDAILINPAAYTHTSVAIRDAISALKIPIIEVHLSNIYAREEFRRQSLTSQVVSGGIYGFGLNSYILGLNAAISLVRDNVKEKE